MFLVSLSGTATVQHISKIKHSVLVLLQLLSHFNNFPRPISSFLCHFQFSTLQRPISSFLCHFQFSTLQRPITCLVSLSVQHTPKTHHLSCVTFSSAHSKDPSSVSCHFQFSTLQRPIICFLSLSVHHIPNQTSFFLWYFQFSQPWTPHLSCVTLSSAHSQDQTLPLSLALRMKQVTSLVNRCEWETDVKLVHKH